MRISRTLLAASLLTLTGFGLVHAQTRELATQGQLLDRIAAVVNDGVVLNSDLDAQIAIISERMRQQKLELPAQKVLRQQVLERLIVQEIEVQRAEHNGVKVSDETLNSAMQDVAQRNGLTLSQLPQALAQQGIDYRSYRDDMRRELQLGMLRQHDVLQRISITPREIEQFLDRQSKRPDEHKEFNVSHILIAVGETATPAQIEEAGKKAQDVYQRAKSGDDFAKLAVANSNSQTALEGGALGWRKGSELQDDATVKQKLETLRNRIAKGEDFAGLAKTNSEDSSNADGGDLGWAGPGTFAPEFEEQISKLKDNEVSEPFKTQFGWHLAQMLGHRSIDNTEEVRRHEAAEAIRASKADEETELWLRRLRDEAYVEYKS